MTSELLQPLRESLIFSSPRYSSGKRAALPRSGLPNPREQEAGYLAEREERVPGFSQEQVQPWGSWALVSQPGFVLCSD